MEATLTGTVRGRVIELAQETGLPSGAKVRIRIESAETTPEESAVCADDSRAAILESAGAWADANAVEFQHWLEWTAQMRQSADRDAFLADERQ